MAVDIPKPKGFRKAWKGGSKESAMASAIMTQATPAEVNEPENHGVQQNDNQPFDRPRADAP